MKAKNLLTIKAMAAEAGVSYPTALSWLDDGLIECIDISGAGCTQRRRRVVKREVFDAFLDARTQPAAEVVKVDQPTLLPVEPQPEPRVAITKPGVYRTRGGDEAEVHFRDIDGNWHGKIVNSNFWRPDGTYHNTNFRCSFDLVAYLRPLPSEPVRMRSPDEKPEPYYSVLALITLVNHRTFVIAFYDANAGCWRETRSNHRVDLVGWTPLPEYEEVTE